MSVAVRAGALIDDTGQAPRKDVTILIEGDRVDRIMTDPDETYPRRVPGS